MTYNGWIRQCIEWHEEQAEVAKNARLRRKNMKAAETFRRLLK